MTPYPRPSLLFSVMAIPLLGGGLAVGARAAHPAAGGTSAPRFLVWNAKAHHATLQLIAGFTSANAGLNFDGDAKGKMIARVPVGSHVTAIFGNKGSLPHSAIVTAFANRTSPGSFPVVFAGASTTNPTAGTASGGTQQFSFVATKAGTHALVWGVPGHAAAGMWDVFTVASGGTPSLSL